MEILLQEHRSHLPLALSPTMNRFASIPVRVVEEGTTPECVKMAMRLEVVANNMEMGEWCDDLIELAYSDMRIAYR